MSDDTPAGFPQSLATFDPDDGFALAVKLARLGVKATQPDMDTLKKLRTTYAENADILKARFLTYSRNVDPQHRIRTGIFN